MLKRMIPVACLTALLGFTAPSVAQFGDAAKAAGKATGDTVKKGAKKTEEGVKTAGSETKNTVNGRPIGTTGMCRDGTYTKAAKNTATCQGHAGILKWF